MEDGKEPVCEMSPAGEQRDKGPATGKEAREIGME